MLAWGLSLIRAFFSCAFSSKLLISNFFGQLWNRFGRLSGLTWKCYRANSFASLVSTLKLKNWWGRIGRIWHLEISEKYAVFFWLSVWQLFGNLCLNSRLTGIIFCRFFQTKIFFLANTESILVFKIMQIWKLKEENLWKSKFKRQAFCRKTDVMLELGWNIEGFRSSPLVVLKPPLMRHGNDACIQVPREASSSVGRPLIDLWVAQRNSLQHLLLFWVLAK